MNVYEKLRVWRDSRNIKAYDHKVQVSNIVEEVMELMYIPKSLNIKLFQKEIIDNYYVDDTTPKDKIDAYCDLIVFSINAIELLGYDADKCMNETIKEISSREQNPSQKEIWSKWGASGKWEKNKDQDISTLYKADYDRCKIES